MRLKFRSYSAHPAYGCVGPGQVVDVPDELVADLVRDGYAVAADEQQHIGLDRPETAMMQSPEAAVMPTAQRKPRAR